jgi:hypothetical protein
VEADTLTIVFTGHIIDKPGREAPRFPADKEDAVREAIRQQLEAIQRDSNSSLLGIAGGASGGDILFHECCAASGIPSEVFLALPATEYKGRSVNDGGPRWSARYDALLMALPVHVLDKERRKDEGSLWEETNKWMLEAALARGTKARLLALWDGKTGDGPGGTEHMIQMAKEQGLACIIIDINEL